jgi:hypothetical protein
MISRVTAMANTASLKKATRSNSSSPLPAWRYMPKPGRAVAGGAAR